MGDLYEGEDTLSLMNQKQYRPVMKKAMLALPELDSEPNDIVEMLFSKDQQLWLKKNLRT